LIEEEGIDIVNVEGESPTGISHTVLRAFLGGNKPKASAVEPPFSVGSSLLQPL
jgi:hypothetical protein